MNRRASFGPVVLLGLAGGALAAVSGNKPLYEVPEATVISAGGTEGFFRPEDLGERYPLVGALALLLLATWGVLLVTRGRARRAMALVGLLVGVGTTVLVLWLGVMGGADAATAVAGRVARGFELSDASASLTGWWWALLAAVVAATTASALAVVLAPHWPEMGSKYDAPSAGRPAAAPLEEQSSTDLWKSLDAGHDPTVGPDVNDDPRA